MATIPKALSNALDIGTTQKHFSGSGLYFDSNRLEYVLKPILKKKIFDNIKGEKTFNPHYLKVMNHQIKEHLHTIAHEDLFTSFITLTTTLDIEDLNKNWSNIILYYNSRYDLNRIMSQKSYTKTKAKQVINRKIKEDLNNDIDIMFKKKIYNKAVFNTASSKGWHNFLKRPPIQQRKFKETYKLDILDNYNLIVKQLLEEYNKERKQWYKIFKFRFDLNRDTDCKGYFKVLEFQKNGKPHYHILSNFYIPYSIFEHVLNKPVSNIYDIKFIFDGFIAHKNNLKKNESPTHTLLLKEYPLILNNINDNELKRKLIRASINYVTKYLTKYPEKTKQTLQDLGLHDIVIASFSDKLQEKYKYLCIEPKLKRLGIAHALINEPIKVLSDYELNPIQKITIDGINEDSNLNRLQKDAQVNNILLKKSKIEFITPQNQIIKAIEDLYYSKFNINKHEHIKDELFYKWCLVRVLHKLKNLNINEILKVNRKLANNFNDDKDKKRFYTTFRKEYFNLLIGGAGSGKSYATINLNHYNSNKVEVLYLTYKKIAKNRLVEGLQEKFNNNYYVDNIDSFIGKRGENLNYLNKSNCYAPKFKKKPKEIILVIDEIGNVTTKQLYDTLSAINLNQVIKIVFAGDFAQDNPISDISGGNSLIPELQTINFIHTTKLLKNFRAKENPQLVNEYETLLKEDKLNDYNLLDLYNDNITLKKVLNSNFKKYNNDLKIICNSKRLRDRVNNFIIDNFKLPKIWLCDRNHKDYGITNGEEYQEIKEDNKYKYLININNNIKMQFPKHLFTNYFILGHCVTASKVQGAGFNNVLVLIDDYSKKLLTHNIVYVSLTRAKKTASIYFHNKECYNTCMRNKVTNDDEYNFKDIIDFSILE